MNQARPADSFLFAYIECALWSSNDESTPQGGEPLDKNYTHEDIDPTTRATMKADCERFYNEHRELIEFRAERAGHDFWLTRNGHGAGFWDGDWPEPAASTLTEAAQKFGEVNLYVHEGKVYV